MSEHRDVGPELQQLGKTVLTMLDPLIEAGAAALASLSEGGEAGKCTQVWCPLCAAAAVAAGESHPLASAIAQQGAALLAQLRAVAAHDGVGSPKDAANTDGADQKSPGSGRYQPIPVTVYE